jgi:hypothetical protein
MLTRWIDRYAPLLIWLLIVAILIATARTQFAQGYGLDTDDQIRLLQLRDWLGGQSWFDTTQYRIGAPDSQPMHWPRWVEVPLALIIVPLTPIIGQHLAEQIAMIAVPMLALGALIVLTIKNVTALFGERRIALLAALLVATSSPVVFHLVPFRIDHHGWQLVLATGVLACLFGTEKMWKGALAGAAMALWLAISLEGLPLALALLGLLVFRWWLDRRATVLRALLPVLIGVSFLLYLGTHGTFDMLRNACDAMAPAHVLAMLSGGALLLPALFRAPPTLLLRVTVTAVAGAVGLAVLLSLEPACATGAIQLDPELRALWYNQIREGLPIWKQEWSSISVTYGGTILTGVIAAPLLWKAGSAAARRDLFTLLYAFAMATIIALLLQRATAIAAAFGLPIVAWAIDRAFRWARQIPQLLPRVVATVGVAVLTMPGLFAYLLIASALGLDEDADAATNGTANALGESTPPCRSKASFERLRILPAGNVAAPFNLGPQILLVTPHNVLATSHHRNASAMSDQLRLFAADPVRAKAIITARGIHYIIACADDPEMKSHAARAPDGLWARLHQGKGPPWAQRVHLKDNALMIWRIKG